MNFSVVSYQFWVSWLTFAELWFDKIKVFGKLDPMVDLNFEFDLLEICIRYDDFPQNAWSDHLYEGFHFFVVWMQGVWDNVIDFVGGLMLKHEEVRVYANKTFGKLSFFCLFHDFSPSLFADEPDVPFWRVSS